MKITRQCKKKYKPRKIEKSSMFMDFKNQHHYNIHFTQPKLLIKCNPNQNTDKFLLRLNIKKNKA